MVCGGVGSNKWDICPCPDSRRWGEGVCSGRAGEGIADARNGRSGLPMLVVLSGLNAGYGLSGLYCSRTSSSVHTTEEASEMLVADEMLIRLLMCVFSRSSAAIISTCLGRTLPFLIRCRVLKLSTQPPDALNLCSGMPCRRAAVIAFSLSCASVIGERFSDF